jgi:hypothetical protein
MRSSDHPLFVAKRKCEGYLVYDCDDDLYATGVREDSPEEVKVAWSQFVKLRTAEEEEARRLLEEEGIIITA